MSQFRLLKQLTLDQVIREWNELAPVRLKQILSGRDITFNHITLPTVFELIGDGQNASVLDAGCGVGVLTDYLANVFDKVVGVDPSEGSIRLAVKTSGEHVKFLTMTIEKYARQAGRERFDMITATMVLMDTPNLDSFMAAVYKLLKPGGSFVFSITHPAFWPSYYGYAGESWFDYSKELVVESPFKISSEADCRIMSTHVHRPIEMYSRAFAAHGLLIEKLVEPMPDRTLQKQYPEPWKSPRYLFGCCRRQKRLF